MKLKILWINGFKNLNNFKIDFENRKGITVLIGNNGSGKSNILEAISAIFSGLYNNNLEELSFKFELIYSIENNDEIKDVKISKKRHVIYRIKKENVRTWTTINYGELTSETGVGYDYRPSQIISLYSGEELRLCNTYYLDFYKKYNSDVISNQIQITANPKMLYINKYYWDIALLTMIASDVNLSHILGESELQSIQLKINTNNLTTFKGRGFNEVVSFIDNFYIDGDGQRIEETETISFNNDNLRNKLNGETHRRLFNLLCVAKLPKESANKLIKGLKLTFDNGLTTDDFSEGHKKQILLKLVLDLLADNKSLVLFDEPDSHIHIANKKILPNMLAQRGDLEVILTTHSPTLMNKFDKKHLFYIENGQEADVEKVDILKQLSGDTMSLAQQQILLNSNDDILIVEGKTDEKYITAALSKLKETTNDYDNLTFNFLYLGGTDWEIVNLLIEKLEPKEGQTIIAFFDRDQAGFKCISKVLDKSDFDKDSFIGEVKDNIYIYFYPKKEGFHTSNFEIEDYFDITKCRDFRFNGIRSFENLKGGFKKNDFADACSDESFSAGDFEGFKVLFDLILRIKEGNED